jgi:methylthioribose-1-phosphate isomerase
MLLLGTALGVIREAVRQGKRIHVYVDETRPLLQGGRLTTYELQVINSIQFNSIQFNSIQFFILILKKRISAFPFHCVLLQKDNIPYTLICDNMAAMLMRQGKIQRIFVGADRIAVNGDFANKIGKVNTYTDSIETVDMYIFLFYLSFGLN